MADQLRHGDFLRPAIAQANDPSVWMRGPQLAFCGWIQALDAWMRNQFVGALDVVRLKIESYVRDFDNAQQAFANGIPGVALPPPPTPVGATPPNCPYPFQMQVPKGTNPNMNPDLMRKGLVNALGRAKEELHAFSIRLGDVLTEPAPVPGAPVVPGAPPMRHLPPDAKEAAGIPRAYEAIGIELEKAIRDVLERADAWEKVVEDELPTSTPDLAGAVAGLGASAGAAVAGSQEAVTDVTAAPPTAGAEAPAPLPGQPDKPPPTPEQVEAARQEGTRLAEEALKKDVLNHPDELEKTAKALAAHKDDPAAEALAAAFVEKFGAERMIQIPRTLQAWQYGYSDSNPGGVHPPKKSLPYDEPKRKPKPEDIEGILWSFSATLATATHQEGSPKLEEELDELASAEQDPLALSWLLTNREADFDADFLCAAFDRGVKKVIEVEAREGKPFPEFTGGEIGLEIGGGRKLDRNPKVAVLNALSRNGEAAARLQTEFQPFTLKVQHNTKDVQIDSIAELLYQGGEYGGYGDNGAAMGRMLNTAHRALTDQGNAAEARELVDQIVGSATNDKEVKRAQESLREIGLRQPVTDEQAEAARALVEKNSKHPARELLLAETADNLKASAEFVKDAAAANKYTQKTLYETRAAWDVVKAAELAEGASEAQKRDAETTLDRTMRKVADGEDLTDEARRGMADVAALHMTEMAMIVSAERKDADELANKGLGVTAEDVRATLKELVKDKEALGTLMSSMGALVAGPYTEIVDSLLYTLPERAPGAPDAAWRGQLGTATLGVGGGWAGESMRVGEMFCEMADAVRQSGIEKREAAAAMLANYRLGVDIAFGFIDKVPGVGAAKGVAEGIASKIPSTKVADFEGKVKDGIAEAISGIDTNLIGAETKQASKQAREMLDRMVSENMMQAMARSPQLLHRLEVTLPDCMMLTPGQPIPAPVGDPPRIPDGFVKPEFIHPQTGGVLLPRPGSEHYEEFSDWYLEDPDGFNPLHTAAMNASAPVREHMGDCMLNKLWDEGS